jgi:uncharacterized RDD family membrane protein YckC
MSEPSGTQYGGFWVRFLALLADSAIVFLVCAALLVGAAMALDPEGLMPAVFAVWLLALLYWPVMHASSGQATFGKAIVGLKVARFDGRRISILRSLWREFAKIFSAAVLMLGYLMAGLMPRKRGLHDLMAATYVVREGPARILPALAVAVAGFAVPVVVGPMVGAAAVMSTMTSMAEGLISEHVPLRQISERLPLKQISERLPLKQISEHLPLKQIAWPAAAAPKATPKPKPPALVQTAKAQPPAPKPEAPKLAATPAPPAEAVKAITAPKPEPVALAQAAPLPVAEPAKPKAAAPKPKPAAAKPKTAVAKPKPAVLPPSAPKLASGPRYNDLMTAVLNRDVEGVNELLKLGKWPDKPDSRGATPLMVAAGLGDVRTAEALLRAGANARLAVPVAEERRDGEMILLLKRYSGR